MGTAKMATTSRSSRGWDPHKTYDVSEKEMRLIQERAKVRDALKTEYQKKVSYPYRGVGSYVFDPAVQRFLTMRAKHYEQFKTTPKNFIFFVGFILAPVFVVGSLGRYLTAKHEQEYRTGQVAYKDRTYKLF